MGDLPDTLEGFQTELNAIAETSDTLTAEQVARYEALEDGMRAYQATADIKRRNAVWNKPSVALLPVSPKGEEGQLEQAFTAYMRTGQPNSDITQLYDSGDRSNMARYDQTITTTAGGYLIPPGFEQRMVDFVKNYGGIATVADQLPTATGQPLQYPTNDDTANTAEIDAVNTGMSSAGADLVFGQVTLGAFSYMAGGAGNSALHVPFELAQDSAFPIVPFVSRKLATRIGRKQASDFAIGTGTTLPKGLFDRIPDTNLASGNFTQTAAVNFAALSAVQYLLDPDYLPNCTWIMRYATLGILAAITDTTGRPIFQPFAASDWSGSAMNADGSASDGSGYRPAGRLLGYPVVVDQASPVVGNASAAPPGLALDAFISFGDHRQAYVIRRVQGITLLVDPYTAMGKRQMGYFAWARADATIQNAKAHVLLAGYHA